MFRLAPLAFAGALLAVAGCDQAAPTESRFIEPARDLASAPGGFTVRGEVDTPSGTGRRIVGINAKVLADGTTEGFYKVAITSSVAFFKVRVTCIAVQGTTAWIGGVISETNSAAIIVGSVSYFFLTDNGRPNHDRPPRDVISTARINDAAGQDLEFCRLQPLLLPVLAGLKGNLRLTALPATP
jgi:hypothetical protein